MATVSGFFVMFLVFVLLLALSAFFSASETSLISANKIRIAHGVREGSRRAKAAHGLILHLDKLITSILVCNNLVNTAMAAIGTSLCIHLFGEQVGIFVATFFVTVIILVFAEITPKILSASHADRVALLVAIPIKYVVIVLEPISRIFTQIGQRIIRFFGVETGKRAPLVTEQEMRFMFEAGREEGIYGDVERKMLHRIFNFGDLRVEDVMIPLKDIDAVPVTATEDDLFRVCVEEGHSRVPVFQGEKRNILGIIYAKDLLHILLNDQLVKVPDILHEPFFVAPGMQVTQLLREFLHRKLQIAIVGHESQAVGLVTLEDLLEEIVGEIDEEPRRAGNGE